MGSGYIVYYMIGGLTTLVGWLIHNQLQSKFRKYGEQPLASGRSGREIAERMLSHYGIHDVKVVAGEGFLSDHYNPLTKTVSLSPEVYEGRSVASAAVAAHECGHAVQHATAYTMLQVRSAIVPVVRVASMAQQFLLMLVFMAGNALPSILLITIGVFMVTTLFSLITLPVEFDASRRALVWLENTQEARGSEHDGAKDALKWAAMTYVAQAMSSLVMLVFLILRYVSGSRD